jgi:hypothetical protein
MNRPNADDVQQQGPRGQERAQEPGARRPEPGSGAASSAAPWRSIEIDRLKEVGRNLGGQLDEQVRQRPYVVLGAAVGVGFVAGSIFGSRLGQMLLAVALGYAAKRMLGEDFGMERIQAELERLAGEGDPRSGRA